MFRRLVREEQGVAVVVALISMLVLGSLTAALLTGVAVNHRNSAVSLDENHAFSLAEDGLAYAEGRLYSAPTSAEAVLVPGTSFTPVDDVLGSVSYWGTLCDGTSNPPCSPKVWTLYGQGTYGGVTRTVSAKATVPTVTSTVPVTSTTTSTSTVTTATPVNSVIWNYIYINGTAGCTTIQGSVVINVPLYTQGSLCLNGNVSYTGSDLEVGGALTLTGSAAIGSKKQPISKLNVVGACTPAPCDGFHSPIYVNVPGVGHTLTPAAVMPTIDLPGTYASSNPGPASGHACPAGSNVPANFFDNDTTLNNSDGTINLFPSGVAYDCKVGTNELKWDGSSKLTVNGVFYFDGSFSLTGNTRVTYSGMGTLYFTGTIYQGGSTAFCGIANCSGNWDTTKNVVFLVAGCWANSTGSSLASNCVNMQGTSTLQAGVYSSNDYQLAGTANNMGPVLANAATFNGNVTQMLPIHSLPPGAPLSNISTSTTTSSTTTTTMTTTTSDGTPQPPSGWNG